MSEKDWSEQNVFVETEVVYRRAFRDIDDYEEYIYQKKLDGFKVVSEEWSSPGRSFSLLRKVVYE